MVNMMHENNPVTVSSWDHEAVLFFKTQRCPFWPSTEWQKLFQLFPKTTSHELIRFVTCFLLLQKC